MLVRFDDARPGRRRGFMLTGVVDVVRADVAGDVPRVLERIEQAVEDGHWVGGWVAYEAGPGLDAALAAAESGGAETAPPLAWFAIATGRARATPELDAPVTSTPRFGPWASEMDAPTHAAAVRRIHDHIAAGETYQVNLTFQLSAAFDGDPHDLYRQLLAAQSGGFGACITTEGWAVASASPELFFQWRDGRITCRPMKGTTRRGVDHADDQRQRAWLAASPKNRAENVMIVDMVRNDLARIATTGGVDVPALLTTEKYDTVWQLTSTVTATPRPDTTLLDVFRALFPSASITGAPKVATTRIIDQVEAGPRGVYCGAIGFGGPGPDGPEWTFNVGIRTITIDRAHGLARYGTGGGITIDSDPDDEHREAWLKAAVLERGSTGMHMVTTSRFDPETGLRHLERHVDRLLRSAAYFDVPLDVGEVRARLDVATAHLIEDRAVRVVVDRLGAVRVQVGPAPTPGRLEAGPPPTERIRPVVRLVIDDVPVDPSTVWLHHKTTVRGIYDDALRRVRDRVPDADDAVLVTTRGHVCETTVGSLAVHLDGRWVTPPLADGLLAGTERAWRLEVGDLSEASITVADLRRADAVGRLNSVRGWELGLVVE